MASGSAAESVVLVTPKSKLLAEPKLPVNAVALSPDGKYLAVARHGEVELSIPRDFLHSPTTIPLIGTVNSVSFSQDGNLLVAANPA